MIDAVSKQKWLRRLQAKVPPKWRRFYSYYADTRESLQRYERASHTEITSFQLSHLNKILETGWKIKGYEEFWRDHDFNLRQLDSLEQVREIPVITKEHIRSNKEKFQPVTDDFRTTKTGGSTGAPFHIEEPIYLPRIELAFIHHLWSAHLPDVDLKTKATVLRGGKIDGDWDFDPMKGLILSAFLLSEQTFEEFVTLIDRYKTPILHAYPSSLVEFVRYMEVLDKRPTHQFSLIALGSEPLYEGQRKKIEEAFNAPVVHWYGQGEKVVLAGNNRRPDSYHVQQWYGLTQIKEEHDDKNQGEIIGTSFWNTIFPLIRYNMKDVALVDEWFDESLRIPASFKNVIGRSHEFLVTKTGSLVPVTALTLTYGKFNSVKRVQFIQKTPGKAQLDIEFLTDAPDKKDLEQLAGVFKDILGETIDIRLNPKERIEPTSSGKYLYLKQDLNVEEYR